MEIQRSIDIEDEVRRALDGFVPCYCRPLPEEYSVPCIQVAQVGGSDVNNIDTFDVVLDARAHVAGEAMEVLRNAVGYLRKVTKEQTTKIRHLVVNSSGSWGRDPVRPDLEMCSARLRLVVHIENVEVNINGNS